MSAEPQPHSASLWARPGVLRIPAATPFKPARQIMAELGLDSLLRLGANENPLGPSPRVVEAIAQAALEAHRYPDAENLELRRVLADRLGVGVDEVVVDAGVSGTLRLAIASFMQAGDKLVYAWPTFPLAAMLVHLVEGVPVPVPGTPDGRHDLPAMAAACQDAKLAVLCNPNNPTGRYITRAELGAFLDAVPDTCLVVVDEAYYEYAQAEPDFADALAFYRQGRRLIVMRTFSKAYALAGARVGYMVAPPDLCDVINRAREPFQVSNLAQAAALTALADAEHVARSVAVARDGRRQLAAGVAALGYRALPSAANFILMDLGRDCRPVAAALLRRGIMTRACDDLFGLPGWLRVSVGTPEQNARFLATLPDVLNNLS